MPAESAKNFVRYEEKVYFELALTELDRTAASRTTIFHAPCAWGFASYHIPKRVSILLLRMFMSMAHVRILVSGL